ncbi:MAG: Transcription elongation factor GreA [Candidatus Magasanikbacteria bacterium GW2011_GWA2_56_11]|uniref:Transcription elongation factor GreA n=1 Tax=Candidatus Magasanikbacteria bacterium GW2011_GWA2_56_11 TaxID=1619044 RepID=A0A0G1YGE4_9BACT|nr:MAG: Transcription elongation factor GreA [Candidatus Magasanikbacteria bacterium GW2011_GWA2_56_11]
MGDLSENAEYHAAREEMSWAQSRAKEIEHILDNAEMIAHDGNQQTVGIGSSVVVKAGKTDREFTIVGAQEADPIAGKISNESPLGQAFLGKKKGDRVEVRVPAGTQVYEILEIK